MAKQTRADLNIEEPGAPEAEAATEANTAPTGLTAPIEELIATPAVHLPDDSDGAPLSLEGAVSPPILESPSVHALPDAADVDPKKIKTMTLTKQGWVLPEASNAQANG